jgi:hypothetical protein
VTVTNDSALTWAWTTNYRLDAQAGPNGSIDSSNGWYASGAVVTDAEGKFESVKKYVIPGVYKVEANRIGYMTDTQSVKVTKFGSKKVEFKLKKIPEGKRKTIEGRSPTRTRS